LSFKTIGQEGLEAPESLDLRKKNNSHVNEKNKVVHHNEKKGNLNEERKSKLTPRMDPAIK
jgi:hypothetical protein